MSYHKLLDDLEALGGVPREGNNGTLYGGGGGMGPASTLWAYSAISLAGQKYIATHTIFRFPVRTYAGEPVACRWD